MLPLGTTLQLTLHYSCSLNLMKYSNSYSYESESMNIGMDKVNLVQTNAVTSMKKLITHLKNEKLIFLIQMVEMLLMLLCTNL